MDPLSGYLQPYWTTMTTLTIDNFSCIKSGTVEASQFTVLIGPQASGKSVVAKLIHFLNETLSRPASFSVADDSYDAFVVRTAEAFKKHFPESAWGSDRFKIRYETGPYHVEISKDARLNLGLRFEFNHEFIAFREEVAARYRAIRAKTRSDPTMPLDFDTYWPAQNSIEELQKRKMGEDYVWHQIFVPAGRSFFTTLGKTSIALGPSVVTDTFTQRFGQLITSLRGNPFDIDTEKMHPTASAILGGTVVREGESESLLSPDGRRIPISLMSSGQQEFFPLATALSYAQMIVRTGLWVFIEEPEAHLFPQAQSDLIELLVDTASDDEANVHMVITTHSPYSMSKLNNLLKAGQLAKSQPELASKVSTIVPESRWLTRDTLAAYAIDKGVIVPLLDEHGLIDATYIDSVSSSLADEFGGLLDLEYPA